MLQQTTSLWVEIDEVLLKVWQRVVFMVDFQWWYFNTRSKTTVAVHDQLFTIRLFDEYWALEAHGGDEYRYSCSYGCMRE